MADIMFAGIGGQGVLTAGKILIQIAAENGKNVSWTSEYSAEMRGGIALCRVVVSDEEIGSPYPDNLDVLVCMNEDAYNTYVGQVADGGKVIINKSGSILTTWKSLEWMQWGSPRTLIMPEERIWL